MKNRYGHFSDKGSEFIITTPCIPRHWYNYLWNDGYIAFTSQVGFGEGFAQDSMGRRVQLVSNRNVYLLDCADGSFWTANGIPVGRKYASYQCVHGIGYSEIQLEYQSVRSDYRIFVPSSGNCEIWTVRIRNNRACGCRLKVIPYVKTELDGAYKPQGYNMATGWFDPSLNAVVGKSYGAFGSDQEAAVYGFMTSDTKLTGYDSRKNAFIGTYGEESTPDAVVSGGCADSDCNSEKLCFASELTVCLGAKEEREFQYIIGIGRSMDDITGLRKRFFAAGAVETELKKATDRFASQTDGAFIQTPDHELNHLFNYWIKHQANMGSRWARVRHNGFRDLTQDTGCMGTVNPALAWERLKRILTYQYGNGYAPRTFLNGRIWDNNFSDNTVWLTFTVYTILMELGDPNRLSEKVAFNDGSQASVYEHIRRSVDFLWGFRGLHGLIKIWGGDWNDTMDKAGLQGRGASVWLSMAWYKACRQFAEIARLTGKTDDAQSAEQKAAEMRDIVDTYGWDGEYYRIAYTDDDIPIGSSVCGQGKIFLIPQLWSVLSGIGKGGREIISMQSVEKYLKTDLGTRISWPSYTECDNSIGHMTEKPAGVNENGGVYLHPSVWKLAVDSLLRRNAAVQEDLEKILPFNGKWVVKKCEPYILCNCYFTKETGYRYATAGQSWRTASGPWLVKAVIEYVYGLQPVMEGLTLHPCLPPDWKSCVIHKKFRGAQYHIRYTQTKDAGCSRVRSMTVNGEAYPDAPLPCKPGMAYDVAVELE